MKEIKTFFVVYVFWVLMGVLSKIPFLLVYQDMIGGASFADVMSVFLHGAILDVAVAGYVTAVAALLLIVSIWVKNKAVSCVWHSYFVIVSFVFVLSVVANIVLYGYWGFPLDCTPLMYLKTSPAGALASVSSWYLVAVSALILGLTAGVAWLHTRVVGFSVQDKAVRFADRKIAASVVVFLLMGLLIIPIRGGFGTGTNHVGNVYFSNNIRLNHAAVNPAFCFLESVNHYEDFSTQYRFMEDAEAERLFKPLVYTELRPDTCTNGISLTKKKNVNVVLVVLEGFSKYIMADGGRVKGVTPCLDRLTKEGIYFSNFYANSIRTDRGIVSILSGFPAQPSMSIMDLPSKTNNLYSIAKTLGKKGYATNFYYGGDVAFKNMRSYLKATGYQNVVSEDDFDRSLRTSKWGAHDRYAFERVLNDMKKEKKQPFFTTLLTLSSHEPFDVPYKSQFADPALNAFAYADHYLGWFVDELKKTKLWDNTLVIMVPDHLGAYPEVLDNYELWRYEIPLVMVGGVVPGHSNVTTIGSQIDIPATLFGLLGIDHSDFTYSKDILDPEAPHFAFFTFPDAMGMINEENFIIYDNTSNKVVRDVGKVKGKNVEPAKAYLQSFLEDIDKR